MGRLVERRRPRNSPKMLVSLAKGLQRFGGVVIERQSERYLCVAVHFQIGLVDRTGAIIQISVYRRASSHQLPSFNPILFVLVQFILIEKDTKTGRKNIEKLL